MKKQIAIDYRNTSLNIRKKIFIANDNTIILDQDNLKLTRSSHWRCFIKVFLKISENSQENVYARVSFLIKLQALAQVITCEFCQIFKKQLYLQNTTGWLLL